MARPRSRAADLGRLTKADLDAINRELAQRDLHEFTRQGWRNADPSPYVDGWHVGAICEHLQAVTYGQIRRIIINVPPRHMKSLSVAVHWPAWSWAQDPGDVDNNEGLMVRPGTWAGPGTRFLFASYAQTLSTRDSVKCRRVIQSLWYQRNWGERVQLEADQNQKTRFENTSGGYRLATSVDGALTGEGGDVIAIDDPHNVREAESDAVREGVIDWWHEAMSTRLNDARTGAYLIIMQRVHANDLVGDILAKEHGWDHLVLPAEYEVKPLHEVRSSIGFKDPRREEGELLWPERMGRKEIEELKTRLGSYAAAGQLQQRPAPREGGLVQMGWFLRYKTRANTYEGIVHSWDCANKEGELNDYSACGIYGLGKTKDDLLEVFRQRLGLPALKRTVISLAERDRPSAILIEDAGNGTALIQLLREETRLPVVAVNPDASKVIRMSNETAALEAGRMALPETAPWLADFEAEVRDFPNAQHDDQVDQLSQFLRYRRLAKSARGPRIRRL